MSTHSKGLLARNIPPITKYPTLYAGRNEHVCVVTTRGTKPEVAEANADRLVLCWNMHDPLVQALSDLLDAMETPRSEKATAAWERARAVRKEATS